MNDDIRTSKNVFLSSLTRVEQLGMLFDMVLDARNWQASHTKHHLENTDNDIKFMKGEIQGIGRRKNGETLTTSKKFEIEFTKRNAALIWYRDKVLAPTLSAIHTIIILAILYFVFGGRIPTP